RLQRDRAGHSDRVRGDHELSARTLRRLACGRRGAASGAVKMVPGRRDRAVQKEPVGHKERRANVRKSQIDRVLPIVALLIVACCALVAVPAGMPPATAASRPPIKIGFSMPLTGDNAATGQKALNAAKLAVQQINARGGAAGRPFELVEGDDQCDPKQASNVVQKFVSEKVIALASYYCSGAALAAMPIIRESQLLFIDIGAVSSKL